MGKTTHVKVVIVGSGPAGYTAAIYAARAMLEPILIQGIQPGGQLTITTDVENYPGFADVIQGPWLMEQMQKQAEHVGTRDHHRPRQQGRSVAAPVPARTAIPASVYLAETLIIATGAQARWLDLPSEQKFKGYGVSACATCDGFFYRGKEVVVIGGGNTAVEEALFLTNFACQGDRGASPRSVPRREDPAGPAVQESEDRGDLGQRARGRARRRQPAQGALGRVCAISRPARSASTPSTACSSPSAIRPSPNWSPGQVEMKAGGYIKTAPHSTATSVPGVFAAGDVHRRCLPPGRDGRRPGLHGGAGSRTISRSACGEPRRRGVMRATRRVASGDRRMSSAFCDLSGSIWTGTSSRSSTPLPKPAASPMPASSSGLSQSAVSRQVSRARTGARRLAVPPPRPRPDPDRAGRTAVPHRARSLHEARGRARQADRQPRTAERRTQGARPRPVSACIG